MLRYIAVLSLLVPAAHAAPLADLKMGDLQFTHSTGRATVLRVRGVDVFRESGLNIVKPGWTHTMLNTTKVTPTVSLSEENGAKVAVEEYTTPEAKARFRYELRPDTFRVSVTYSTTVQPAWMEYEAAYLNANIISGRPFTAQTVQGPRSGTVAAFTDSSDQVKSRVCPFFTTASFDSRVGPVTISVEGNTPETANLNLFDARGITLDWAFKNPMFWLGIGSPERAVPPGDNTVTVTWKFGQPPARMKFAPAAVSVLDVTDASVAAPELPVIPRPKQMNGQTVPFRVTLRKTFIALSNTAGAEEKQAARELQADLKDLWGISAPIRRRVIPSDQREMDPGAIVIATMPQINEVLTPEQLAEIRKDPDYINLSKRADAYYLSVERPVVSVIGSDARGAYYGVQTLKQLIRRDAKGVYIKPVEIRDWPSLSFRGLHWYGGPDSWPFHQRMIDRIAAPLKINEMVYECDFSQWKSQPAIWNPQRSTPLDQVRKTVAEARAHFIEPIPLIPTLGHTDWLFQNGQNLAFSADRKNGHAYDPTLPASYDALFGVMQEAIDIFQPKWFHIGHDEVTTYGDYLPPAKVTEYYVKDVQKIHGWLKAKGIGTMVWGDELLHASETPSSGNAFTLDDAKVRRAGLPKDVVVADWHYRGDADYPSVDIFQGDGHKVIGCTWARPSNIRNFSKALADKKAWGLLQTTWDGYSMSIGRVSGASLEQYAAYVLAAEYAWNGGEPSLGKLGYNPMDAFLRFWEAKPEDRRPRPGFKAEFHTAAPARGATAEQPRVRLAGKLADNVFPDAVEIPVNGRAAKSVRFVWGTDYSVPVGTAVATLSVRYADGTAAAVPIIYGRQIAAFNDLRTRPETTGVWSGQSRAGELRERRAWTWMNPQPDKHIDSISIISANTEAAPVLLEISGIQ